MRRWITLLVVVLAVLDVAVLAVGYRTRSGVLPAFSTPEASYTMLPPSAAEASSTPDSEATVVGPVLMAVNADGLVLRATRGACEERFDNHAQVAVGSVHAVGMTPADVPDLAEVLGVAILPDDHLRMAGLNDECEPMTVDSTDSGQSWQTLGINEPAGIWHLDPDTTADTVTGPAGSDIPVTCIPVYLTNLPDRRGAISCGGGVIYALAPGSAPIPLSASDFDEPSVAGAPRAGRYYVFGPTAGCEAQVAALAEAQQSLTKLTCIGEDRVPQAIAAAGRYVVVQIGDDVMVSEDAGRSFVAAG
jgi:hypothetical protein